MRIPFPEVGLVIRYGFLWGDDADSGRESATKSRPCAIVTMVDTSGERPIVTVAPITHAPQPADQQPVEIPLAVKRALGLDDERSWIVTNEVNTFGWPGPDIEPIAHGADIVVYGRLPRPLLIRTIHNLIEHVRAGRVRTIKRSE
jgi:hypothetical protein